MTEGDLPRNEERRRKPASESVESLVDVLDELLAAEKTVLRDSRRRGGLFLGLGALATTALYLLPDFAALPAAQKLGPCAVMTAIASLHFEPLAVARERIAGYRSLRRLLIRAQGLAEARRRTVVRQVLRAAGAIGDG